MSDMVKVAVDAMGGDNAPDEVVKGAVDAVNSDSDICVLLTGVEDRINTILASYTYDKDRINVVNATEIIETGEHPVNAIMKKKDSSIVVAFNMVKKGEASA